MFIILVLQVPHITKNIPNTMLTIILGTIYLKAGNYSTLLVNYASQPIDPSSNNITSFKSSCGSVAWLTDPGVTSYYFDEVTLLGQAQLAIMPQAGANISIILKRNLLQ